MSKTPEPRRSGPRPVDRVDDPILENNAILEAWRICYLANYVVFPLYRHMEKEFNITRPEWVALFCLAHQEPICAQDIMVKTWLPKNSINRGVKLLAQKGLITKRKDPQDGRRTLLSLTQEGWKIYSQTLPFAVTRKERLISSLDDEELRLFNKLLMKLCVSVSRRSANLNNGE